MKAFVILAVLVLCGISSASDQHLSDDCLRGIADRNKCCEGVPNAWYAHLRNPKDCTSFYQCEHGQATWKACAPGTHWSVQADRCDWPQEANCTVDSRPTGTTTQASIGSTAKPKLPSGCYDDNVDVKICCNGITDWLVHLPDPEDCGKFYQCDNGKAVRKDCPGGLHWSVAADRCEWPQIAQCSFESGKSTTTSKPSTTQKPSTTTTRRPSTTTKSSSTTTSENNLSEGCYNGNIDAKNCCNGITDWLVHLPDPDDCGKFYQCDNGKAVHKDCPGGLHWSVAADRCEWPQIAKCSFESGKSTTTSKPATTQKPSTTTTRRPSTTTKSSSTTTSENNLSEGCYNGNIDAKNCCNGITDWLVHLPDPDDCGKFYQCDNGKAVHKDCPSGLHWSVAADRCEWPQIAKCSFESGKSTTTSKPSTTQKPSTTTTRRPSTTTQGSSTTTSDDNLSEACKNGNIDAKTCCNGITNWWVHLPDPEDCGKFYQCDNGKAVHKDCPSGLHWSIDADQCEWPETAGCSSGTTTTKGPPTPPPEDDKCSPKPVSHQCLIGFVSADVCCSDVQSYHKLELANAKNCSSYYKCVNGKAILRECPTGLHWSIPSERCEWPAVARCKSTTTPKPEITPEGNHNVSRDCLYGNISAEDCCRDVPYWKDVLLQNNADCHTYIQCVHGTPMVRPCPTNLYWSVTKNRCEWKQKATCIW